MCNNVTLGSRKLVAPKVLNWLEVDTTSQDTVETRWNPSIAQTYITTNAHLCILSVEAAGATTGWRTSAAAVRGI